MSQIKVELQEFMGDDRSVANSAWTSSLDLEQKEGRTDEDVTRIVKYLAEHRHSVPFESVVMRFWIRMPIQTDRQHVTHRIASHNGLSGRYRTMPEDYMNVPDDIYNILLSLDDWYGSTKEDTLSADLIEEYDDICKQANAWYRQLLTMSKAAENSAHISNPEYKRIREFFRGVLPQNNMTERVTTINLRSFANYQALRNSEHAQPEIQEVAQLMLSEVKRKRVAPVAIAWLEKNGWQL